MLLPRAPSLILASTLAALLVTLASAATAQQSRNVTLLSNLNLHADGGPTQGAFPGQEYSAGWSYVHHDGREYAISCATNGVSIVRLTDPTHPVEVAFFPLINNPWHEAKQYREWVYVTTDLFFAGTQGLQIINMQDPDRPRLVGFNADLGFIHTVTVDEERGLLYLNGMPSVGPGSFGSMHIFSLADPEHPVEVGVYPHYVHDIHLRGTIGFADVSFDEDLVVLDLSDPANPREITRFATTRGLAHSSWTSEDGRFLYHCDEVPGPGALTIYDISDLASIRPVFFSDDRSQNIVHNPRVRGNTLFLSYYTAGVRLWDISNPAWPVEYGYYDTFAGRDGGFHGAWEVAPYYPSGIFIVNDMETGLYVFRADPPDYGIVRGTVREGQSGPPVAGALVTAQPGGLVATTMPDGRYALTLDAPGSYTLTVTKFAFDTSTKSVRVAVGDDRTVDFALRRTPTGTVAGTVLAAADGSPLGDAELELLGTPLRTTSDAGGSYRFESVPEGSYTLRCVRPGYARADRGASVTRDRTTTVAFSLAPAFFYDDASTDRGWSLADRDDDAERGLWIRAVPLGTAFRGTPVQTDRDHSPDPEAICFVTGNGTNPRAIFEQAVRDGKTTLTSPSVPLAGVADPRIAFWRWYVNKFQEFSSLASPDPLVTEISNDGGATWVRVDTSFEYRPSWDYFEIRVLDFFASPGDVRVRFIASESEEEFALVEAAIDDFMAFSGGGVGAPASAIAGRDAPATVAFGAPRPSPTRGAAALDLFLPRPMAVRADVFDVQGRRVRTLEQGSRPGGRLTIRWDGRTEGGALAASGIYWLRVRAGDIEKRTRLVVAR